jgi:hypothetical protein
MFFSTKYAVQRSFNMYIVKDEHTKSFYYPSRRKRLKECGVFQKLEDWRQGNFHRYLTVFVYGVEHI